MKITLQFKTPNKVWRDSRMYWELEGTATGDEDTDGNIFVYQLGVVGTLRTDDTFVTVASASQMEDLPVGSSGLEQNEAGESPVYYRTNTFTFLHRHEGEVTRVMDMIKEDVAELMQDLEASQELKTEATYEITPEGTTQL